MNVFLRFFMAVKFSLLFGLLLTLTNGLSAQCMEQQPSQNASGHGGLSLGQSFIPDCNGAISTITMLAQSNNAATTVDMAIKDVDCNVIWTALDLPLTAGMLVDFDVSGGSGITRNVVAGNTYSFHVSNANTSVSFRGLSVSGYTGCYMTSACSCISTFDFLFTVEIEEAILPVEFVDFSATSTANYVQLDWQTATETNNIGFDVERSKDGHQWNKIGFVAGNGTTNHPNGYTYRDHNNAKDSKVYYRLKQLDSDGQYEYSRIRIVTFDKAQSDLGVYPNPANNQLFINGLSEKQSFVILNRIGEEVMRTTTADRIDISELPSGIYFLRSKADDALTVRFMKQ